MFLFFVEVSYFTEIFIFIIITILFFIFYLFIFNFFYFFFSIQTLCFQNAGFIRQKGLFKTQWEFVQILTHIINASEKHKLISCESSMC